MEDDEVNVQSSMEALLRHRQMRAVTPNGVAIDIPQGPDDPRWVARIPKPYPLPGDGRLPDPTIHQLLNPTVGSIQQLTQAAPTPTVGPAKRVVVSYGPRESQFIVAVEVAPDWDTEGDPIILDQDKVVAVVQVARLLGVKIKNLSAVGF